MWLEAFKFACHENFFFENLHKYEKIKFISLFLFIFEEKNHWISKKLENPIMTFP
jgi:hypothetical protein